MVADLGRGHVSAGPADPRVATWCSTPPRWAWRTATPSRWMLAACPSMFAGDVIAGHGTTPFIAAAQARLRHRHRRPHGRGRSGPDGRLHARQVVARAGPDPARAGQLAKAIHGCYHVQLKRWSWNSEGTDMADGAPGGTLTLADDLVITRMGFGAMQLAGPGVFGPPKDRDQALAVLREAVDLGITHIDTSDFYGPVVVNELIRAALHPYPAACASSPRSAPAAARTAAGAPRTTPPTSGPRSTRTWNTSAWTSSTSSTCASRPKAAARTPSPSRSAPWPACRRRA